MNYDPHSLTEVSEAIFDRIAPTLDAARTCLSNGIRYTDRGSGEVVAFIEDSPSLMRFFLHPDLAHD